MAYSIINDISTSGTITAAAQNVFLNISGHSAGSVQITGTWVGTIGFEGTTDGTTWLPINGVSSASSAPTPNAAANALYRITPGGLTSFRIVSSAWTSGTAVITIRASSGTAGVFANQILPARITDGTNTTSIKPASTAAAATDIPLVVALHPSSPTPNFLLAQAVTGTRLNNGTSNAAGSTHLTIGGSDGTNLKPLLVDVGGRPIVKLSDGTNSVGITAAGIAGSEVTVDRLKVNASLRLLDIAQAAGSQLVAAKGDQTTGLWVNVKNTTLPVTGSFFQATQPVSIATMPTTPVTGTFFQTTQPVSGAFFQTTQPISAAALPLPTGAAQDGTDITTPFAMPAGGLGIRGWLSSIWTKLNGSLAVTGTFFQATQPVSLATNTPVIAAGTNKIGSVDNAAAVALTTASAAALNADVIPSTDVSAFKTVVLQTTGTWVASIQFQGSNDNITFYSVVAEFLGNGSPSSITPNLTNQLTLVSIPIKFKFLRVRITSFTSGTVTGVAIAYSDDRLLTSVINTSTALTPSLSTIGAVQPKGVATNGNTMSSLNSAATTNATLVKASAATVYTISIMNTSAANRFVRIYNLTTAPTVGTSIPIMVIAVPATSSKELEFGMGIPFSTGLSYAITAGAAATDATVVAAGDVQFAISWN